MISAFGAGAERYAAGLGDISAVVADIGHIVPAYWEAARRRERGESFYGMLLADDARIAFAYAASQSILDQFTDPDRIAQAFKMTSEGTVQAGGRPASEVWSQTPLQLVSEEFYRIAGAMLVRSYAEFAKFAQRSGAFAQPVERVLVEPALPHFRREAQTGPAAVIWGPHRDVPELGSHLFGLREFLGDVWCVAAQSAPPAWGATIVTADDPRVAEFLARAGAVVCVEPNDPGDAVAFARHGFGVVAAASSGAHEFADVTVWDAADATVLHQAVTRALARPARVTQPYFAPPPAPSPPPAPKHAGPLPLVSILMPTYNRPNDLRKALEAVAAQTYPRVEAIVVNDAGAAVDDVTVSFPFATLITHEVNRGVLGAVQTAGSTQPGNTSCFCRTTTRSIPITSNAS